MGLSERKQSIKERFSETSPQLIELLEQMLQFNHYFRPTARELLRNKIFDQIRISSNEEASPSKIIVDIDKNEYKQSYGEENGKNGFDSKSMITAIQVSIVKDFLKLTKNQHLQIKVSSQWIKYNLHLTSSLSFLK